MYTYPEKKTLKLKSAQTYCISHIHSFKGDFNFRNQSRFPTYHPQFLCYVIWTFYLQRLHERWLENIFYSYQGGYSIWEHLKPLVPVNVRQLEQELPISRFELHEQNGKTHLLQYNWTQ